MTVRSKTVCILLTAFVGLSIIFDQVFDSIILDRFRHLEQVEVRDNLKRGLNGISAEIEALVSQASDWSKWDDTYQFVENENADYKESNFTYASLVDSGVSELLLFNQSRKLIVGVSVEAVADHEQNGLLREASPALLKYLRNQAHLLQHDSTESVKRGMLNINNRIVLYASLPILTSAAEGPIHGTLFWARYLDESMLETLRDRLNLDLRLNPIDSTSSRTLQEGEIQIEELNEKQISARTTVLNSMGEPALSVSIVDNRNIYEQGIQTRSSLIKTLLISGAVFSLMIFVLFEITVLSKMRRVSRELNKIEDISSIEKRIEIHGNDEIAEIGSSINRMLNALSDGALLLHGAKLEAESANRSKSDFITNISHEVRTPLNGVMGMLRAVLAMEKDADKRQYLQTAFDSSQTLLDIINDILDLSKIEVRKVTLEKIPFSIFRAVEEAMRTVSLKGFEKGLEVVLDIDRSLPIELLGDPLRIKQIVMNLLGNAIKFTDTGGVTLRMISQSIADGVVELRGVVEDSGIGIPPEKLDLIFSPFSQADAATTRRFGGTGLGLSISKNLIELMGGSIWIESIEGVGSKFHFTLKLEQGQIEKAPLELDVVTQTPMKANRVIIAFSGDIGRAVLARQLFDLGAAVCEARSADEALAYLSELRRVNSAEPIWLFAEYSLRYSDQETLLQHVALSEAISSQSIVAIIPCHKIAVQESLRILGIDKILVTPHLPQHVARACTGIEAPIERRPAAAPEDVRVEVFSPLHILVADDIQVNRLVLSTLLSQLGHTVVVACDGREVIKTLERDHWQSKAEKPFDLLLIDLQMPDLDGFATTRLIKRRERRFKESGGDVRLLPVVAVSAHELGFQQQHLDEIGFEALCPKPIDPQRLSQVLESVSGRKFSSRPADESSQNRVAEVQGMLQEITQEVVTGAPVAAEMLDLVELYKRFSGEEDIVGESLGAFCDECDQLIKYLDDAVADNDRVAIESRAHALKGSLINISAKEVGEWARQLEKQSATLPFEEIRALSRNISAKTAELRVIIVKLLAQLNSPSDGAMPGVSCDLLGSQGQ